MIIKDFFIAVAWASICDFAVRGAQQFGVWPHWLPDASYIFAFVFAMLFYSRNPVWERR